MTENQIRYLTHQENVRHNLATEANAENVTGETVRANRAKEAELQRSNLVKETETHRHNVVDESVKLYGHLVKLLDVFNPF